MTNGKKIKKGHVLALTDTSLQLKIRGTDTANLALTSIGKIKTRRSWGHKFLIGSLMGSGMVAISGTTNIDPHTLALPGAAIVFNN